MVVSAPTFAELAVTEEGRLLELRDGVIVEKPPMSIAHNRCRFKLAGFLFSQLDSSKYEVRINASRVFRPVESYYIPDLMVIPVEAIRALGDRLDVMEAYTTPLPLVVEIWSPTTGDDDVDGKLPRYQERGDAEIWRLQPFARTLTAWRRQPNGMYLQTVHTESSITPLALPGVAIDIAALFDF
jgi:Uma2 family endonuclease